MMRRLLGVLSLGGRLLRRTPLARSALLNRVLAAVALRLHGTNRVRVGPFRLQFDPRDQVLAKKLVLYGGYEEQELTLLCSLVEPGDQVADIGANIGLYSLYLSRAVGPEGLVIAVEPDPDNLALLQINLRENGCENVQLLPCAFGAESGEVELFQVDHNRGMLSFADLGGTGRAIRVPVQRGEEALAELGVRPRVVKLDVEGAEPLVLAGLGYWPEVLLLEFVPEQLRALGQDPERFLASLVAEGYTLERIDPDSGRRVRDAPASLTHFADQSGRDLNVLARRL